MTADQKCKGFWNMCGCKRCREADRKLDAASEDEKKVARKQFLTHFDSRTKPHVDCDCMECRPWTT